LYGKGAYGLAQDLGITEDEAQTIINSVIGQLPQLGVWLKSCHDLVQTKGGVYTYWDGKPARFRPLWGAASGDMKKIGEAKRQATNTPVQGTASEYTIKSLIELVKWILADRIPAKVVATVHDSILLEIRNDYADVVVPMTMDIMTSWPCGGVPIQADAEISFEADGKLAAWGRLKKWRGSLDATMNYKEAA
jgi:DNA polymerase-1